MRARIVKKDEKIVVLKSESGKFLKVPKKNLDFQYKLGDYVTIEKNGDEIYILPQDASDFWGDEKPETEQERDGLATGSLIFNFLGMLTSFISLWNFNAGLIWIAMTVIGIILGVLSKAKKSKAYKASRILLSISITLYLIIFVLIYCGVVANIKIV